MTRLIDQPRAAFHGLMLLPHNVTISSLSNKTKRLHHENTSHSLSKPLKVNVPRLVGEVKYLRQPAALRAAVHLHRQWTKQVLEGEA